MIHNQDTALKKFMDSLEGNPVVTKDFNKGRHKVVSCDDKKYYVVFKRDFFKKFPEFYPEFVEKNAEYAEKAESLNTDSLARAILEGCDLIIFVHPEKMYQIYPAQMRNFCVKYNLKRKQNKFNEYKVQGGMREQTQEVVYHVPFKLLKEWL
jgi:hypothetical protein